MQGQQANYLDTRLFSYRSELLLHQNCLMFIFRDLWTVCWHAMGPTKISTAGNVTFYNCRCVLLSTSSSAEAATGRSSALKATDLRAAAASCRPEICKIITKYFWSLSEIFSARRVWRTGPRWCLTLKQFPEEETARKLVPGQ